MGFQERVAHSEFRNIEAMNILSVGRVEDSSTLVGSGNDLDIKNESIIIITMRMVIKGRNRRYFRRKEREMNAILKCSMKSLFGFLW